MSTADCGSVGRPVVYRGPIGLTTCNAGGTSAGWRETYDLLSDVRCSVQDILPLDEYLVE